MRPRKITKQKRNRIEALRKEGLTIKDIAKKTKLSPRSVSGVLKDIPKEEPSKAFPYYANAKIFKHVENPRLVWVVMEDDDVTKLAIKRPDRNYPPGVQVTVRPSSDSETSPISSLVRRGGSPQA